MSEAPHPLTPSDCELQDFAYLPVDVAWIRNSDMVLNETPEVFWAMLLLWAESWHQVPAASIPNDDDWLACATRTGKAWPRMRASVLREWVMCSDGRLYHPRIADRALRAWAKKQATGRKLNRRLEIESAFWAVTRSAVFERDNYTCVYCGAQGVRLEADHIVPVSRGGETSMANLATACKPCNRSKGVKLISEWRACLK